MNVRRSNAKRENEIGTMAEHLSPPSVQMDITRLKRKDKTHLFICFIPFLCFVVGYLQINKQQMIPQSLVLISVLRFHMNLVQ